jgi:hypothetical protein
MDRIVLFSVLMPPKKHCSAAWVKKNEGKPGFLWVAVPSAACMPNRESLAISVID